MLMQIEPSTIFAFFAAFISVGGILITVGVLKGKINHNDEVNKAQAAQIEACATKGELNTAAARADERLAAEIKRCEEASAHILKRLEEDRASGEGRYRELYGILGDDKERITVLETTQKAIDKSLEEIKSDIKTGFADVKTELKELRKQ
jgi:septation ring formation regulator EzrA